MSKWDEKRLEDIIDVDPKMKLNKGTTYPFIDIDQVSPDRIYVTKNEEKVYTGQSSSKFCNGDTVFSRITPCLENRKIAKVSIDENSAFGSTEFYVFRAKKDVSDERYVYYLCSSDAVVLPAINSMSGASGRQRADKRYIQRIKLSVPDLPTQKKIADILTAYDDLIENNLARISLLEKMASELYKEWFVRFRFPRYKTVKFVDRIPEGWEYVPLKDILTFSRGISYSSEELTDDVDGHNLINLKNISAYGGFNHEGTKKYRGDYKESQIVNSGDLVMGITDMTQDRRTVGSVALIPPLDGVSVISADLLKINSEIDNIFLYCLCKYGYYSKYFSMFANGANVLHLRPDMLYSRKILLPPIELINEFVSLVSPLFDGMNAYHKQNEILIKQRDLLLPRLMSGKLSVEPLLSETA